MNWHKRVYTFSFLKNHQMHVFFFLSTRAPFYGPIELRLVRHSCCTVPWLTPTGKHLLMLFTAAESELKRHSELCTTCFWKEGSPESCVLAGSKSCTSCRTSHSSDGVFIASSSDWYSSTCLLCLCTIPVGQQSQQLNSLTSNREVLKQPRQGGELSQHRSRRRWGRPPAQPSLWATLLVAYKKKKNKNLSD